VEVDEIRAVPAGEAWTDALRLDELDAQVRVGGGQKVDVRMRVATWSRDQRDPQRRIARRHASRY
jgi:hypothetical protein